MTEHRSNCSGNECTCLKAEPSRADVLAAIRSIPGPRRPGDAGYCCEGCERGDLCRRDAADWIELADGLRGTEQ